MSDETVTASERLAVAAALATERLAEAASRAAEKVAEKAVSEVEQRLQVQVDEIHHRVFNGLGLELRKEIGKDVHGLSNRIWGVIFALLLAFAGIIIEGRVSSNQVTMENMTNYKAIVDLDKKIEMHLNGAPEQSSTK